MSGRFEWRKVSTEYREVRGHERRWLVNKEEILDTQTGHVEKRGVMRHPGVCVVAPFLDDDTILLMRQYRYSLDGELWELPAGTLEGREEKGRMAAAETPEECAARELKEETGYRAARWEKVAECYAMPGSSDELIHVFFARDLEAGEPESDAGEVICEVRAFTTAELERMIGQGEVRDAKTLVTLFYALSRRPSGARIAPR